MYMFRVNEQLCVNTDEIESIAVVSDGSDEPDSHAIIIRMKPHGSDGYGSPDQREFSWKRRLTWDQAQQELTQLRMSLNHQH